MYINAEEISVMFSKLHSYLYIVHADLECFRTIVVGVNGTNLEGVYPQAGRAGKEGARLLDLSLHRFFILKKRILNL